MNRFVVMPKDYYRMGVNCGLKVWSRVWERVVNDVRECWNVVDCC